MEELDEVMKERIMQNKEIFSETEIEEIFENNQIFLKVYALGILDIFCSIWKFSISIAIINL